MVADKLPKGPPFPRELEPRPTRADFRMEEGYGARDPEPDVSEGFPAGNEPGIRSPRRAGTNPEATEPSRRVQQEDARTPIDHIAALIQSLTYGEMMEFAESLWQGSPDKSAVTQETLPALLYCWSLTHAARTPDASEDGH